MPTNYNDFVLHIFRINLVSENKIGLRNISREILILTHGRDENHS